MEVFSNGSSCLCSLKHGVKELFYYAGKHQQRQGTPTISMKQTRGYGCLHGSVFKWKQLFVFPEAWSQRIVLLYRETPTTARNTNNQYETNLWLRMLAWKCFQMEAVVGVPGNLE